MHFVSNADFLEIPVSPYTLEGTVLLEFGRFGFIESVSFEEEMEYATLHEVRQRNVSETNRPRFLPSEDFEPLRTTFRVESNEPTRRPGRLTDVSILRSPGVSMSRRPGVPRSPSPSSSLRTDTRPGRTTLRQATIRFQRHQDARAALTHMDAVR